MSTGDAVSTDFFADVPIAWTRTSDSAYVPNQSPPLLSDSLRLSQGGVVALEVAYSPGCGRVWGLYISWLKFGSDHRQSRTFGSAGAGRRSGDRSGVLTGTGWIGQPWPAGGPASTSTRVRSYPILWWRVAQPDLAGGQDVSVRRALMQVPSAVPGELLEHSCDVPSRGPGRLVEHSGTQHSWSLARATTPTGRTTRTERSMWP